MDAQTEHLTSASDLARDNSVRIPNESAQYRAARTALLAEEVALRRQIAKVADLRHALPPGGAVSGDYRFMGEDGPADFAGLFAGRDTLIAYTYMFGAKRERPCPMCTATLDAWEGNADDVGQHASLVVIAGAPIERLKAWKAERGWKHLRLYSDLTGAYLNDYFGFTPDGGDGAAINVFTLKDGVARHFWSDEMSDSTADPGQDPRGAPDAAPLWMLLDFTPNGRPGDWYPKLRY
jgi:predicted dithiol-disulfide oxidoreductase (DUF899 family)